MLEIKSGGLLSFKDNLFMVFKFMLLLFKRLSKRIKTYSPQDFPTTIFDSK